jgi:hypothetical protein
MSKRGNRRNRGRSQPTQALNAQDDRNRANNESAPSNPLTTAPIIPQATISPNKNHSAAKDQKPGSDESPNDWLLVRYTKSLRNWTVGLVLVGLLTVAVLSLHWLTFEKTDETNRVGLRPYISGVGLKADTERFLPIYWALSAIFENSGGTPPIQMRYVIRSSADFSSDPEEIFQHPVETDAFFDATIAPKGQISVNAGTPLISFFNAKGTWYVSGAIHYHDQFSGSPEHISKFCFAVIKTNVGRPGYDPCPYWNCIDEKACADDRARYDKAVRNGEIRPAKKSTDPPTIPLATGLPSKYGPIIKAVP